MEATENTGSVCPQSQSGVDTFCPHTSISVTSLGAGVCFGARSVLHELRADLEKGKDLKVPKPEECGQAPGTLQRPGMPPVGVDFPLALDNS